MGHVQCDVNNSLPFFAYGIFKPGQLAFSKIEDHVEKIEYFNINYEMHMRDGVPIVGGEENVSFKTYGYLIYFKNYSKKEAYNIISETEPDALYYWDSIKYKNIEFNVLKGKDFGSGSSSPEYDWNEFYGQKDPFFKEALELIDDSLNSKLKHVNPDNQFKESIKDFFNLQMHYMLLWSAIDRFASLKYNGEYKSDNNYEISQEKCFKKSFKKHFAKSRKCRKRREIYTTDNLYSYKINSFKHNWAMNYYYKMRCNVVHRGKTVSSDQKDLKCSLIELSNIFKDILKDTFNIVTIDGVNFNIPYGLTEISNENDSTRLFNKDESNPIKGIPDYTIKITPLGDDFEDEITTRQKDIHIINEIPFRIQIDNCDDTNKLLYYIKSSS